jgi:hypothetical protein
MKLILTMAIFLVAAMAQADSFTVIRDGKNYLCEEQGPIDPGGNLACVNKAYSGPFSKDESVRLCSGAHDESPALCGIKAYGGPFSKDESIQLCIGARSNGPVDCAIKAYGGPFSKPESLELCQGGTLANAECAIKAYAGPYSKPEAIRMCKSNPALVLKSLNLIEQSSEIQEKIRAMKKEL